MCNKNKNTRTNHNFPFIASYFQLVENKCKNNSKLRLDVRQQAKRNRLYFINAMILGSLFPQEINYIFITHIQATICKPSLILMVSSQVKCWKVSSALFGSMSIQGRWAGFRKIKVCLNTVFSNCVFQPVLNPSKEWDILWLKYRC